MRTFKSDISDKTFPENQKIAIESIRQGILDLIKSEHTEKEVIKYISRKELDEYRQKYIESSFKNEFAHLSSLEKDVLNKLKNEELVSEDSDKQWEKTSTMGQKIADKVADFGGSWTFIIIFCSFILLWIIINITALFAENFDPYPFILLNLFLSCLAALQAPVIMMSQNRVEEKDRQRAKDDYKINLKSEIEIQMLHEKIDHLIINQQGRLFEIQDIQVEMLREIVTEISELHKKTRVRKKQSDERD